VEVEEPQMNNTLEMALKYVDKGFNIIPIPPNTKASIDKWKRFQTERVSKERVRAYWSRCPDANIAVICGEISGLIVADADPKNGAQWEGVTSSIAATTPHGGKHFYYRYDKRIPSMKPKEQMIGWDMQSDGTYVLASPSIVDGKTYTFDEGCGIENDLQPPPAWLFDVAVAYKTKGVHNWRDYMDGTTEGTRNEVACKIAGAAIRQTGSPQMALAVLRGWNTQNSPCLEDKELQQVVTSIWGREQRKIGTLNTTSIGDLMRQNLPPPSWLIENVWLKGGRGWLAGEPEQGKTWFALDMALSITQGWKFLGNFSVPQIGPVLFIEEDQTKSELLQRVQMLIAGKPPCDLGTFHTLVGEGISFPRDTNKVVQFIRENKCVAVFIDHLRAIHNSDQNSSMEMKSVLDSFTAIRRETGAAVITIHHISKGEPRKRSHELLRMEGTQHFLSWADSAIGLFVNDRGTHNLAFKMRGAPKPEGLVLQRTHNLVVGSMTLSLEGGL
jgi:hypothetical protein